MTNANLQDLRPDQISLSASIFPKNLRAIVGASLLALTQALTSCSKSPERDSSFPEDFKMQASMIALGTDMQIKDQNGSFGSIQERMLNLARTFEYFDHNKQLQAKAKARLLSWGTHIDVTDAQGLKIGSIEEQVIKSLFKVSTSYVIKDATGAEVADSGKLDLFSTEFKIKDRSQKTIATMNRSNFDIGGATWHCHVDADIGFDKRLLLFIPAYKTASDSK